MVIGGGPAGMWAAKTAALRGHQVTLYEKENALGGQVAIAMKGAGREEFGAIIRNERNQLLRLKVPVILGREVTAEFVLSQAPDAVIVATGSRPKTNPVPGAHGSRIYNVWQVLKGEADIGEKVLFIDYDGHHQATATAEYLAQSRQESAHGDFRAFCRSRAGTEPGSLPGQATPAAKRSDVYLRLRGDRNTRPGSTRRQRLLASDHGFFGL